MSTCVLITWPLFFLLIIGGIALLLLFLEKVVGPFLDWAMDTKYGEEVICAIYVAVVVLLLGLVSFKLAYEFCKGRSCPAEVKSK